MFLLLRPKQPSPASSYLVTRPRHLPLSKVLECKRDCNGLQLVDLCRTMQIYVWYMYLESPWFVDLHPFAWNDVLNLLATCSHRTSSVELSFGHLPQRTCCSQTYHTFFILVLSLFCFAFESMDRFACTCRMWARTALNSFQQALAYGTTMAPLKHETHKHGQAWGPLSLKHPIFWTT